MPDMADRDVAETDRPDSGLADRRARAQVQQAPAAGARTVVVGVDGSPGSVAALLWAADEVRERGDELLVVHVCPPARPLAPYAPAPRGTDDEHGADDALASLQRLVRRMLPPDGDGSGLVGTRRVRLVARSGTPSEVLVEIATNARLIVLGAHAEQRAIGPALGSTAAAVTRRSPCPLVVVPPPAAWSEPIWLVSAHALTLA